MSLGLVIFSNINYLFIGFIYDVILTAFRIILSTWLYNYQFYQKGRCTQKAKPVQGVRLQ